MTQYNTLNIKLSNCTPPENIKKPLFPDVFKGILVEYWLKMS